MKKLCILVVIALILQYPFHSFCQFSRQQAVDLMLDHILVADTGHISLYCSYSTILGTNEIILEDGQTFLPTYQENWVFFSDDHPRANWYHPCRIIFVNSNSGDFQIYTSLACPTDLQLNYQPLNTTVQYPCPADCEPPPITPSFQLHTLTNNYNDHLHAVLINGVDRFAPMQGNGSCTCNFDFDIAVMYNALEEKGYYTHYHHPDGYGPNDSHVKVLYDSGDTTSAGKTVFHNSWDGYKCHAENCGYNEVDGPGTKAAINDMFTRLSDGHDWQLKSDDQLVVYISGNGYEYSPNGPYAFESYTQQKFYPDPPLPKEYFTADDLRQAVKNIKCAQIVFVLQFSYSGGFINPLLDLTDAKCGNRLVITSTGDGSSSTSSENSYRECWMHCSNIDEFTYYFAAALRGYYEGRYPWQWLVDYPVGEFPFNQQNITGVNWGPPDGCNSNPHPSDYNPDSGTPPSTMYNTILPGNNDGYTQLIEAFNYAKYMDTWCKDGYFDQTRIMYAENPPGSHIYPPYPTLISCTNDYETPQIMQSVGFDLNSALCMNGIAGNIPNSSGPQTVTGGRSYLLGGNLNVHSSMSIGADAKIAIGVEDASINVYVDQNNTFTVGSGLSLTGTPSSTHPDGFNVSYEVNPLIPLDLEHVNFTNVGFSNFGSTLKIGQNNNIPLPRFSYCPYITSINGDVNIINSIFNYSSVYLGDDPASNHTATVDHCHFATGTSPIDNLAVTHLKNYYITNNIIDGGLYGIGLYYDGSSSGINFVQNNYISHCTAGGIFIYQSKSLLDMNHIHDIHNTWAAGNGVSIMDNNCNVSMTGTQSAQDHTLTQEIIDCDGLDIYATTSCFPYLMRFNVINDDGIPNNTTPYVY
jgi:hypothetical protein